MNLDPSGDRGVQLAILVLLLSMTGAACLRAQGAGIAKAAQIESRARSVIRRHAIAQAAFREALRAAKTPEARRQALTNRPRGDRAARALWRVLATAQGAALDNRLADETLWCFREAGPDPVGEKALKRLLSAHRDAAALADLPGILVLRGHPRDRDHLRALRTSRSFDVAGEAELSLAQLWAQSRKDRPRAIRALQRIVASTAPDPRALRRRASQRLFALQHLVPGARAPELKGRGLDGKDLTLSAFRGRVVLIEFWGVW